MISKSNLEEIIRRIDNSGSICWSDILRKSTEIVLFGSWATDTQDSKSDIDLLCVDFTKRLRNRNVDVVGISRRILESDRWLTSELANHIATFGIWLKGDGMWRGRARITESTVAAKRLQVGTRVLRLALSNESAGKGGQIIRGVLLDLLRLRGLRKREATPPRADLEARLREMDWSAVEEMLQYEVGQIHASIDGAVETIHKSIHNMDAFTGSVYKSVLLKRV